MGEKFNLVYSHRSSFGTQHYLGCRWITGLVPNHTLYGYFNNTASVNLIKVFVSNGHTYEQNEPCILFTGADIYGIIYVRI